MPEYIVSSRGFQSNNFQIETLNSLPQRFQCFRSSNLNLLFKAFHPLQPLLPVSGWLKLHVHSPRPDPQLRLCSRQECINDLNIPLIDIQIIQIPVASQARFPPSFVPSFARLQVTRRKLSREQDQISRARLGTRTTAMYGSFGSMAGALI